jgi:chromosome segregation ATPase
MAEKYFPTVVDAFQQNLQQYDQEIKLYKLNHHYFLDNSRSLEKRIQHLEIKCNIKQDNNRQQSTKNNPFCHKIKKLENKLSDLKQPTAPKSPDKPDLALLIRQYSQNCHNLCSCQPSFRLCFQSCGGQVKEHKYCVENCYNEPQSSTK